MEKQISKLKMLGYTIQSHNDWAIAFSKNDKNYLFNSTTEKSLQLEPTNYEYECLDNFIIRKVDDVNYWGTSEIDIFPRYGDTWVCGYVEHQTMYPMDEVLFLSKALRDSKNDYAGCCGYYMLCSNGKVITIDENSYMTIEQIFEYYKVKDDTNVLMRDTYDKTGFTLGKGISEKPYLGDFRVLGIYDDSYNLKTDTKSKIYRYTLELKCRQQNKVEYVIKLIKYLCRR